ncbi:MAG TPA: hypothetical protein VFL17_01350 [Anaerolineae bacterium]|nr:hypothetical protein [Anaerolineae bacterium]
MSRLQAIALAGIIAVSAALALSLLMVASAQAAPGLSNVAAHGQALGVTAGSAPGVTGFELTRPGKHDPLSIESIIAAQTPLTCTYTVTTPVSDVTNNFAFTNAAALFTYNNLTLLPSNAPASPSSPLTVTVATQYFRVDALQGFHYLVSAIPNSLSSYNLLIVVYNVSQTPILTSTKSLGSLSASVDFVPSSSGTYYFAISHIASNCPSGTYKLTADGPLANTATPTRTPGPSATPTSPVTPIPGADRFEPNFNFDRASLLALDVKYTNLNFAPWAGSDPNAPDNDFYKVYVKPGLLVTCETLELGPGVDTNLILYDNNTNGIGGSEDIDRASGNFASRLTYYVTYEGWLYALVGNVYQIDPTVAASYSYSFQCYIGGGPTATPTVTRIPVTPPTPIPTNTPTPSLVPTLTPTPTPTPPFIVVNEVATATPVGQQTVVVPISLVVYYDLNDNRSPDPGEGVVGISARVIDVITGQELRHGFTDANGFVSLTTQATGVVRLVVPYLSYSVVIQPSGSQITLRIAPSGLPDSIP